MKPCTCTGVCKGPEGLGEGWQCVMQIDPEKTGRNSKSQELIAGQIHFAEQRMRSVDLSYMPVYPGGQKQFNEDCQVLAVAWLKDVKELRLWRWLACVRCTVQEAAVAPWEGSKWFVADVDNIVLGEGNSPTAAIEDAQKNCVAKVTTEQNPDATTA